MSRLRIRHTTGYRYESPATASYNEARMTPATNDDQFVLFSRLDIRPNTAVNTYEDYWGTKVTAFEVLSPHTELQLTATSLVEVRPQRRVMDPLDWKTLESVSQQATHYVEQLEQTDRTAPRPELLQWAAELAGAASGPDAAAHAIADYVHSQVAYLPESTHVHTKAAEAWDARAGVCQDIAHITLGALRSIGIPSRYVSGYLHPKADAAVGQTVVGESHAWVEWFTGSWVGWDPTNDCPIGERHVRIGHGRDYDDVPPLRGIYAGKGSSTLFVSVEITRES